jgi:Domain of unknown function (DUF4838)
MTAKRTFTFVLVLVLGVFLFSTAGFGAVTLADEGKAPANITCVPMGNAKVKEAAVVLAGYLKRMSGATFPVVEGDVAAADGISLVLCSKKGVKGVDTSKLKKMGPEAHMIKVADGKVLLVGKSEKAVLNACYDFLERLGCRWLIPSERWTVVPKRPKLIVDNMTVITQPDFAYRAIWYAYGMGYDESKHTLARDYWAWANGNRMGGVAKYKCGHTYASTVGRHKAEFTKHPEFFAMKKDGTRLPFTSNHKSLCYSNPRVAELFIMDKIAELRRDKAKNAYAYTVSMDPNDGSEACSCEKCKALGNGSDQCLYLANQVAKAIRKEMPDAVVTFYVYASHRLPPEKVKAEPNINVQVAMGFNRTQYSLPELVRLWRKKVPAVGIRDYLGVMAWDWGLPGRAKGSRYAYIRDNIPVYKSWGATSYNAETNCNWGSFGPASYVATKLLWDTKADADKIHDDYFQMAFGKGASEMKKLYDMWHESTLLSKQNIHLWYRQFDKAWRAAAKDSPEVHGRFIDMAAYLHYVRLYADWASAKTARDRKRGYETLKPLLEFTWRIRKRQVMHAYALQRRLVNSGDKLIRPLEKGWRFNDPKAVWKHPKDLTDKELRAIYKQDLVDTPADKRLRMFSKNLVPLDVKTLRNKQGGAIRYNSIWYALVEKDKHLEFRLPMMGVRFQYVLTIQNMEGKEVWKSNYTVAAGKRYDRKKFSMDVKFPKKGLYKIMFKAGEDYRPDWPKGLRVVLEASESNHPMFRMLGHSYFYVPKDTKIIRIKTNSRMSIVAPSNPARVDYNAKMENRKTGCIEIPVGKDAGKVWKLHSHVAGRSYFLNIPPYVASDPSHLLVPAECVTKE